MDSETRFGFVKEIYWRKRALWPSVLTVIAGYDLIVSQFAPVSWSDGQRFDAPRLAAVFPWAEWWVWLMAALVVATGIGLEGAFRRLQEVIRERDSALRPRVARLTVRPDVQPAVVNNGTARLALIVESDTRVKSARGRVVAVRRHGWEPPHVGVYSADGTADWDLRWNAPDDPGTRLHKTFDTSAILNFGMSGQQNDWWLDVAAMDGRVPALPEASRLRKDQKYEIEIEVTAENAEPIRTTFLIKQVDMHTYLNPDGSLTLLTIPPTFEVECL